MLSCLCARRKPARRGTDCNLQRLPDPARLRRKPMKMSGYIAGAAAMALVALGPNAIAQQGPTPGQPGTTTGPAAGSTVQPSTAVQKETPAAGSRGTAGTQAQQGGMSAGAPGVTAQPGTEAGPARRSGEGIMPGVDQGGMSMLGPGTLGRMHRAMMGITGGGATMPRHMMKIVFAIMDADGDGTLSFEEVMAIHKRIFNAIDANKDGKVSLEELEAFMRD